MNELMRFGLLITSYLVGHTALAMLEVFDRAVRAAMITGADLTERRVDDQVWTCQQCDVEIEAQPTDLAFASWFHNVSLHAPSRAPEMRFDQLMRAGGLDPRPLRN